MDDEAEEAGGLDRSAIVDIIEGRPMYFDNGGWCYRPAESTPSDTGSVDADRPAAVARLLQSSALNLHVWSQEKWDARYAEGVTLEVPAALRTSRHIV